jgi:hypothetical protein
MTTDVFRKWGLGASAVLALLPLGPLMGPQPVITLGIGGPAITATPTPSPTATPLPPPVLERYPYLTDMTATGVSVDFATDTQSPRPVVKWGPSGGTCRTSSLTVTPTRITVAGDAEYQYAAPISGLSPNTSYCYRIVQAGVDLLGTDDSPVFTTFAPAGASSSFSFAVLGDWGLVNSNGDNSDQANVLDQVAGSGASFIVTTGDNAYPDGSQTNFGDLRHTGANTSAVFGPKFWKQVGKGTPAFLPVGNHNIGSGQTSLIDWPQPVTTSTSAGRYKMETYCCLDGSTSASYPSAWYAFTYGQARFYVLEAAWADTNPGRSLAYQVDHDYHWTPTSPEYQWLKADLAAHSSTPLKFASFHYPMYSDNTVAAPSDTFLEGQSQLEGLLSSNGVAIAFSGHAHLYERNRPVVGSMATYVTGGGGGTLNVVAKCSAFDGYAIGWTALSGGGSSCNAPKPTSPSQVFHFLLVSVSGTSVTVTPTDETGATFDEQTYQR